MSKKTKRVYDKTPRIPEAVRLKPKNIEQENLINRIDNCQIVFATGPAGTGKTFVALRAGLEKVIMREKKKLYQVRPAVPAGERLGFLPGSLEEKLEPYHAPIEQMLKDYGIHANVDSLKVQERIEVLALAYARGYTFSDCYVLVTEAQNMTPEQILMILTRIGEDCTMVIEGDINQHDLKGESGLADAVKRFKKLDNKDIAIVELREIVRNPLIEDILDAYSKDFLLD